MTNREKIFGILGRAEGLICALYATYRDSVVAVDDDKNGKMGDVVGDMLDALQKIETLVEPEDKMEGKTVDRMYLKCLRCGRKYDYSMQTFNEISYRMYSYCPDCIDRGIEALKEKDKEEHADEDQT